MNNIPIIVLSYSVFIALAYGVYIAIPNCKKEMKKEKNKTTFYITEKHIDKTFKVFSLSCFILLVILAILSVIYDIDPILENITTVEYSKIPTFFMLFTCILSALFVITKINEERKICNLHVKYKYDKIIVFQYEKCNIEYYKYCRKKELELSNANAFDDIKLKILTLVGGFIVILITTHPINIVMNSIIILGNFIDTLYEDGSYTLSGIVGVAICFAISHAIANLLHLKFFRSGKDE